MQYWPNQADIQTILPTHDDFKYAEVYFKWNFNTSFLYLEAYLESRTTSWGLSITLRIAF